MFLNESKGSNTDTTFRKDSALESTILLFKQITYKNPEYPVKDL